MLPVGVIGILPGHEVHTVQYAGFKGLSNGELLRRAAAGGYEVLLTADRNIPTQQHLPAFGIALVLVRGSTLRQMMDQTEGLMAALAAARPGTVSRVEPGGRPDPRDR